MNVLLIILGFLAAFAVPVARAAVVAELNGRYARRITAHVEATITSLPENLKVRWADEWRADLATTIAMPWSAWRFASGVRLSARELVAMPTTLRRDSAVADAVPDQDPPIDWPTFNRRHRRMGIAASIGVVLSSASAALAAVAVAAAAIGAVAVIVAVAAVVGAFFITAATGAVAFATLFMPGMAAFADALAEDSTASIDG